MISNYIEIEKNKSLPRLPLEGNIDLTYRCNNNCRHCWLRIPATAKEKDNELSFNEIKKIVNDARKLGCKKWFISGGEPMLRPDFIDIFDYITASASSYSINTNGALITPQIAKLMKLKGTKMVALYGATADIHDHITRNPGSFEATMKGFAYLKEAGVGFIVQIIPMRDNYHQYKDMLKLAESLSPHYRIGASWLFLSAYRDAEHNKEILSQRLSPEDALKLDEPNVSFEESMQAKEIDSGYFQSHDRYYFSNCINNRREFHIDPYGMMTFCSFIKDSSLRYDLRKGNFKDGWENFIPLLAHKIKIEDEYLKNCGACESRSNCRACPVYSYLEHGRFSAKVGYLCKIAQENKKYKENWKKQHRRYYQIAEITIQVDSDLPITDTTFSAKFRDFAVNTPGKDIITISHHFSLPELVHKDLGLEVYRKPPWAIYKKRNSWIYLGISPLEEDKALHRVVVFNQDHTMAQVYNDKEGNFLKGNLNSLTLFPTDQILLARVLADRQACYLHSSGVDFNGKGFIFAGHSGAGKSTMSTMLQDKARILCDDRIIIRKHSNGFKIYGTWSHGDVPIVSSKPAPLKAVFFLKKAKENKIVRITDKKEISKRVLGCLIKPFVTNDWWEKTLGLVETMVEETNFYLLHFEKSGKIIKLLKQL